MIRHAKEWIWQKRKLLNNSRDWIFGEDAKKADLETARVAVIRELREEKYDAIIEKTADNSQVSGDMESMSQFTLKNI